FNPSYLIETSIVRNNPNTKKQDTLYKKILTSPEKTELLKINIENLLSAIKIVEEKIKGPVKRDVDKARDEFRDATKAWEQKNKDYDHNYNDELVKRTFLEIVDSAISLAKKGGPSPAAVAFELSWRSGEWIWGSFGLETPKVSESYINHIKRLGLDVDKGVITSSLYAVGRRKNIIDETHYLDPFVRDPIKAAGDESKKEVVELISSTLLEAQAQRKLAEGIGWWSLVNKGRWKESYELFKRDGFKAFHGIQDLSRHITEGEKSFSGVVSDLLKDSDFKKEALKDVGKSLGFAIVKDRLHKIAKNRRFEVYIDLAILEIDWFLKRNAYNKAMWLREGQKKKLASIIADVGTLYYKKYGGKYNNEINLVHNFQIATSQVAKHEMIDLNLKFSKPVKQDLKLNLEGQSRQVSPAHLMDNLNYKISLGKLLDNPNNFKGGPLKLTVKGKSMQNLPLDGIPQTLAYYNVESNKWVRFESRGAGDQTNTIDFIKPKVNTTNDTIYAKPTNSGVSIDFLSVNSFNNNATISVYKAGMKMRHSNYEKNPTVQLNGKLEGSVNVDVSLEVGDYEIRMDDGFGNEAAKADLKIIESQGDLNMRAFDKEGKETDFYVRIFKIENNNEGFRIGIGGINKTKKLNTGNYKLYFSVGMEVVERAVEIKEGETTHIEIHLKEDKYLVPPGWAKGTLYNSNNGACSRYKGKYLVFMNAGGGIFKNLKTGEKNQFMVVAAGEKLEVAAPISSAWIRVFATSYHPKDPSKVDRNSISSGTVSQLINGWWYSAGCKDGTRPVTPCDNGTGSGPKYYPSCNTHGED
ncbi:hypothetical protein JYT76_03705, partial [Olleya sp. AH-315-F22]|nr:hypothetical protein [Olleya sp. AH-315-F22]